MSPLLKPVTRIRRLVTKGLTFPDLRDQDLKDRGAVIEFEMNIKRKQK